MLIKLKYYLINKSFKNKFNRYLNINYALKKYITFTHNLIDN